MNKAQNLLRLNFGAFNEKWALNYAYTQLRDGWVITPWKKDIFYFIIDWLSDSDTIKVNTSGSTGTPKTISLLKEHVKASAEATNRFFDLKKGDNALLCLPVKYIAGKLMIVRAILGRYNLYCVEPTLSPAFEEAAIDFSAMTPAQVSSLLKSEEGSGLLNTIDKLIVGGDKIPSALEKKLQDVKTKVWHTYGMTETITHVALRRVNGDMASPAYTPMENVSISQQDGRIVIDAEHLGVRNLVTNDLAVFNNDGSFKVLGRIDNVVVSGGVKLFPEEIEKKLEGVCSKPFYFSGKADEIFGAKLIMYVESSEALDVNNLLQKIKLKVEKFEVPKEIIIQKQFKRTVSGKIIRE